MTNPKVHKYKRLDKLMSLLEHTIKGKFEIVIVNFIGNNKEKQRLSVATDSNGDT